GRIYRVHDPATDKDPVVLETKKLLAEGMQKRSLNELARLLAHRDMRVRREAQFALADRGPQAVKTLANVAPNSRDQLGRLHSIWGLGQILSRVQLQGSLPEVSATVEVLGDLLADGDAEVRAQAAKVLGDGRCLKAYDALVKLSADASPRARFFATL